MAAVGLSWLSASGPARSLQRKNNESEKLVYLRRLDAHTLDLLVLPGERRRLLAGVGSRSTAQALQRRDPERRYPILLMIAQSAVGVLDEVLLLFDQALSAREAVARAKMNEALARSGRRAGEPAAVARRDPDNRAGPSRDGTHSVDIDGELAKLDADGYRPLLFPPGADLAVRG